MIYNEDPRKDKPSSTDPNPQPLGRTDSAPEDEWTNPDQAVDIQIPQATIRAIMAIFPMIVEFVNAVTYDDLAYFDRYPEAAIRIREADDLELWFGQLNRTTHAMVILRRIGGVLIKFKD